MTSTYIKMWDKVKELTTEQQITWRKTISPCSGKSVDFHGVHVVDIDLAEALTFMIEEAK